MIGPIYVPLMRVLVALHRLQELVLFSHFLAASLTLATSADDRGWLTEPEGEHTEMFLCTPVFLTE